MYTKHYMTGSFALQKCFAAVQGMFAHDRNEETSNSIRVAHLPILPQINWDITNSNERLHI